MMFDNGIIGRPFKLRFVTDIQQTSGIVVNFDRKRKFECCIGETDTDFDFFAFFEIYFRNFWRLFLVNLVYSLISVLSLGFANGLAKAGMTHVARSLNREKHSFLLEDFFETIKKNWKQSLTLGVINVVLSAILTVDVWYFWGYITRPDLKDIAIMQILGLGVALALAIVATYIKYYI